MLIILPYKTNESLYYSLCAPKQFRARDPNNKNKYILSTEKHHLMMIAEAENNGNDNFKKDINIILNKFSYRKKQLFEEKKGKDKLFYLVTKETNCDCLNVLWFNLEEIPILWKCLPPTSFQKLLFVSKVVIHRALHIMSNPGLLCTLLNMSDPCTSGIQVITLQQDQNFGISVKQSKFSLSTFILSFYMKKFISLKRIFYKIVKKKKDDSDD